MESSHQLSTQLKSHLRAAGQAHSGAVRAGGELSLKTSSALGEVCGQRFDDTISQLTSKHAEVVQEVQAAAQEGATALLLLPPSPHPIECVVMLSG